MQTDYKPGTVRQISFPGCLLLSGPVDAVTQLPRTKMVTLAGIQAPEFSLIDKENPKQEPYGFQTREYLRKMLLGQKVEFNIEHKIKDSNEKVIGSVKFQGKDVSQELLKLGLAKARQGAKGVYEQLENDARQKKLGLWNESKNATLELNQVKKVPEKEYKSCLVEDVSGLFIFYVYVNELKGLVKCTFGDIFMPQASQQLTNLAKWLVGELILQKEVDIVVKGYEDKFQAYRVDIQQGSLDVKKELLLSGYYKLAQNAYQLIGNNDRYKLLKEAQDQAELKGVGIWKDAVKKSQPGAQVTHNNKVFDAVLVEVHSGDSLTVFTGKKEPKRLFLASIRAPAYTQKDQKPWGYEAKEFVRKHGIGKNVRVEVEFEKTIQPKQQEGLSDEEKKKQDMHMIFANVIVLDDGKERNLSQEVVQAGLAQVQPPRGEDGYSRYIDNLKQAQETAEKKKVGLYSKAKQGLPKFNDFSYSATKAKSAFSFLKDEKKVTGVVELVLNGSRYKMRFNEQSCYGLFLLSGVKCLPNDQNFPEYSKFSNAALVYGKEHILQRDVEIELESLDKKGVFHGHIFVGKTRENYAQKLLEAGLAVTYNPVPNKYQVLFADAEERAKTRQDGVWSVKNLNLTYIRGTDEDSSPQNMRSLKGEVKKLGTTEIIDSNEFYFQDTSSKDLRQIESVLGKFTAQDENKLIPPIKKGALVAARFEGSWYRAKVLREIQQPNKDPKYEVFFIDYGNFDQVLLNNVRKCPNQVTNYANQAIKCQMAYIKGPSMSHALGDKVGEFVRDQIFEKELLVQFEHTDEKTNYVIIYLTKEKDPKKSLNYVLLQKGYAKLDRYQPGLSQDLVSWQDVQDDAERERVGIWNYDDDDEDDDE